MSDSPDAFKRITRVARKEHKCCECFVKIEAGTKYQYSSGVWEGRGLSFKQCADCGDIMSQLTQAAEYADEGPSFRGLGEFLSEDLSQCDDEDPATYIKDTAELLQCEPSAIARLLGVAYESNDDEFKIMVERGTLAWADVPDSTAWVERLRGVIVLKS